MDKEKLKQYVNGMKPQVHHINMIIYNNKVFQNISQKSNQKYTEQQDQYELALLMLLSSFFDFF